MTKKGLSTEQRNALVQFLLQNSKDGKPFRGKMQEAQQLYSVSRAKVYRLWAEAKKQQSQGKAISLQSGNLNRKR